MAISDSRTIELFGNGNDDLTFTANDLYDIPQTWALAVTYDTEPVTAGFGGTSAGFDRASSAASCNGLEPLDDVLRVCKNPVMITAHVAIPGDANLDGVVDVQDLAVTAANESNGLTEANWVDGDFDGNGIVDASDLNVVGVNWQREWLWYPPSAAPVPEPNSRQLLVGLLLAACCRARRK